MSYTFRPAVREETWLLIGLGGPSGSGKTASALKLARGILDGADEGIYVLDTEADRAKHYACAPGEPPGPFSFRFQHGSMRAPFSSDAYREAIGAAVTAGARVLIVDSMSHEHEGEGGMLEAHAAALKAMGGRDSQTFAAWIGPKAAHNKLVNFILQQRCHFIFCFRAKDKMKLVRMVKDGRERTEPVQLGWTAICSDRFEYEMTTFLMLPPNARGVPDLTIESTKINAHHLAFFPAGQAITEAAGRQLAEWARGGGAIRKEATAAVVPPTPEPKAELSVSRPEAAAIGPEVAQDQVGAGNSLPSPEPVQEQATSPAPPLTPQTHALASLQKAYDALGIPDPEWYAILRAKIGTNAPETVDVVVIEEVLLPYLRRLARKDSAALDELADILEKARRA